MGTTFTVIPWGRGHVSRGYRGRIRYDTIEEFNVDSEAECDQLNLAHVARKKYEKEETKTNKRQCPLSSRTGSRSVKAVSS